MLGVDEVHLLRAAGVAAKLPRHGGRGPGDAAVVRFVEILAAQRHPGVEGRRHSDVVRVAGLRNPANRARARREPG